MTFDFDKAFNSFKTNPAVQNWMLLNKPQLVALTVEKIMAVVLAYVNTGDAVAAITSALSLDQQAEGMVGASADAARRQYDAGQRLLDIAKAAPALALKLLLSVLAAGVML